LEHQRIKIENAFLRERETTTQELIQSCKCRIKNLEEENEQIKKENRQIQDERVLLKELEIKLTTENNYLQEFGVKILKEENERLKNELAIQEERYQKRRGEDMQLWQMMMESTTNGMDNRKRKRAEHDKK